TKQALLQISDLRLAYDGRQVLSGLELEVRRGEVVALMGLSGVGKTSALRAVAAVREVAGGRAADGLESEGGGRVDRRGHDAVLEGERRMGHRVVLHPHPRHAEAPCERRSVD